MELEYVSKDVAYIPGAVNIGVIIDEDRATLVDTGLDRNSGRGVRRLLEEHGIKVTVIPDPAIRLANLRAGKIDTMGISKSQYRMIKNDPNLYVHTFLDNYTAFLFFNHVKGPCKDPRIRKAISHIHHPITLFHE